MKNCINSVLYKKPLKELPKRLIYKFSERVKVQDNLNCGDTFVTVYNMFDTQTKQFVGSM